MDCSWPTMSYGWALVDDPHSHFRLSLAVVSPSRLECDFSPKYRCAPEVPNPGLFGLVANVLGP